MTLLMMQVLVRVPLGGRQVQVDVQRVKDVVRRIVHLRRRCRLAVDAPRRTAIRADVSRVAAGIEESSRR